MDMQREGRRKEDRRELWKDVVRLTQALYRVTDRFPAGEPLCNYMREHALEILAEVAEWDGKEEIGGIAGKIDTLSAYFFVATEMNWIAPINMEVLLREYTLLKDTTEREFSEESKIPKKGIGDSEDYVASLALGSSRAGEQKEGIFSEGFNDAKIVSDIYPESNDRQKVILRHLSQAKQAKISDFYSVLEGVSSKTIQRDLLELVNKNFLRKDGEKRWTVYSLNNTL